MSGMNINFNAKKIRKSTFYKNKKIKIENYIKEDLESSKSDSDSNNETQSDIDE